MPGFPVLHHLLELTQTHAHRVGDAIQPSHSLSPPSPPALSLLQHQSFPVSRLFASGGHSIGASVSASVLPMNIQADFFLGLTGLTSLLSRGLSRVFFGTIVQKHQFFSIQPSLWSKSHIPSTGIPDHLTCLLRNLYAGQEATVRNRHGTTN